MNIVSVAKGPGLSSERRSSDRRANDGGRHARFRRSAPGLGVISVASYQSGLPLFWINERPLVARASRSRSRQLLVKRAMDIVLSLLALVALAPLLLLVAAAVKVTSRGPVLFSQQRQGKNGRPFNALKFRSMKVELCDESGVKQTTRHDPRVTAVGRFLRRTSIDELPQLFNILRGDMSLVGPRPHVEGMLAGGKLYTDLVPYYARRLDMTPGLTGWAQANGLRGSTADAIPARARVDHDIAYAQNFTIWLDFKIIGLTLWREFFSGSGE